MESLNFHENLFYPILIAIDSSVFSTFLITNIYINHLMLSNNPLFHILSVIVPCLVSTSLESSILLILKYDILDLTK